MHKNIIALCLVCSVVLGSGTTTFASTNTNSTLDNNTSITTGTKAVTTEFTKDDLAKIQGCISRQSDGTLKLDMNAALKLGYKSSDLTQLETYFSFLNKNILSGELKTDKNLNITNTKSVQANGIQAMAASDGADYSQVYWWGLERFANNQNSKDLANKFTSYSWGSAGIDGASKFLINVFKVSSKFLAPVGVAVAAIGVPYFGYMGHRISTMYKGHGVVVDLTWVGVFSVKTQW
ncbi:hypothetical protein KPL37_12275 [Clostridium frigoris]|uniref:Uncharacterized protein n=1 Tax=Clostridium frigoris TaxID=205327 RepID=A0ABS6BUD0_9CLOT|nr:hypothetical protein [Clostridium frigoris]MBU3160521.1 hypothetical protein [Clostridium frigoris]